MYQCRHRRFAFLGSEIVFTFSFILIIWFIFDTNTIHIKTKSKVKGDGYVDSNLEDSSTYNARTSVNTSKGNESFETDPEKKARTLVTDVDTVMDKLNEEKVLADDPRLINLIRNHFIEPPSELPYNLVDADKLDTSMGQAAYVDNRLGFKEGGFFVEGGAHDGEYLSNTLFLERTRHWTGILIEPLPEIFKQLQNKHRKAHSLNACLSVRPYPSKEYLTTEPVLGRILKTSPSQNVSVTTVHVQCFPLYSVLLALGRTSVDFLSLDVEGVEAGILETIPWNKVNITMMSIENDKWPGGVDSLCEYMEQKDYECAVNLNASGAADTLFKKQNR